MHPYIMKKLYLGIVFYSKLNIKKINVYIEIFFKFFDDLIKTVFNGLLAYMGEIE